MTVQQYDSTAQAQTCPLCGGNNACRVDDIATCWCAATKPIDGPSATALIQAHIQATGVNLPPNQCVCQACLQTLASKYPHI